MCTYIYLCISIHVYIYIYIYIGVHEVLVRGLPQLPLVARYAIRLYYTILEYTIP